VALQGLAFAAHGLLRKYGLSGNKEPEIVLAEAHRSRRYLRLNPVPPDKKWAMDALSHWEPCSQLKDFLELLGRVFQRVNAEPSGERWMRHEVNLMAGQSAPRGCRHV